MNLLKKFKVYIILIVLILILSGVNYYQKKAIDRKNLKIERLTGNVDQLLNENADYTTLNLTLKELDKRRSKEVDSLAKLLKVKPRWIEKTITITNTIRDTVKVPVLVTNPYKNVWILRDSTECFKYASKLIIDGSVISANRELLEIDNTIIPVFYKDAPHIWFIRTGKWRYLFEVKSKCGVNKTETITFVKR